MEPRIETLTTILLIGQKVIMSFANNKTFKLWQSFSPRKKEIKNRVNNDLFSVEIYPNTSFFREFDPAQPFEKWAAVAVSEIEDIPSGMNTITLPEGLYAVFHYKGKPSEIQDTFQYIYGEWLPNSGYEMDARPYFALMGGKYKGEHPDSEEEFWIPIKKK
ncbi:GyrI-like domain-containing protein [Allomuricauda sp. NBRC 101325]|uniref:GyrI-like domain-containing protein n=1 Tax=Allomuricauda sp. NBRC 101325 TaxID=1113758 RepID=UPI0024A446AF|nr:GyrI-like domain-containing protein [Muricauda sp. NBRC 101325]GLU43457.1 hypothetical protein Musp01_10810 [Muricauda sp. NBRC 101325]